MLHWLASLIGAAYLHLVGKTSFVWAADPPAFLSLYRRRSPFIYAFWHNNQVFLAYHHRGEQVHIMVSRSKDGEYIAQVMKRMGLKAVRGSSSRGGGQALREILDRLQNGEQAGFTPDGPRGPVQTVHDGVIGAARLSGCPIIPTALSSRRKLVFNSWDKFVVPLPFSVITVAHGEPILIPKEMKDEDAKEKVRAGLNATQEAALRDQERAPAWGPSLFGAFLHGIYGLAGLLFLPLVLPLLAVKYGFNRSLKSFGERLGSRAISMPAGRRFWFHAASIGEWQALKPLLAEFKKRQDVDVIITVTTPEARSLVAKEEPGTPVRLCPLDLPFVSDRWIQRVQPEALFLVETELWPNLIRVCEKRRVPVFVLNGRLSNKSVNRWKIFKPFITRTMRSLSRVYARSNQDADNFQRLGVSPERIHVTGNLKCDNLRLIDPSDKARAKASLAGNDSRLIVVAGSTWPGEEEAVLRILEGESSARVRVVLAPRRLERIPELASMLDQKKIMWTKWSEAKAAGRWTSDVLLVDGFGELGRLYQAGDIAFVGGTLTPKGGQNPLEPASAHLPVLFGPSLENFMTESTHLLEEKGARRVANASELGQALTELAKKADLRRQMGERAADSVRKQQGAVLRTCDALHRDLNL